MEKKHAAFLLAAVACSVLLPRVGAAQVALGPVELVLGTPKAAVVQALRRSYRVDSVKSDETDEWVVENSDGPPFRVTGFVRFTAGRLSGATREWTPGEHETSQVDAVRAVIGALLTVAPSGRICGVEDRTRSVPGLDARSVAVVCGQRTIFISLTRYQGREEFTVTESLSASGP